MLDGDIGTSVAPRNAGGVCGGAGGVSLPPTAAAAAVTMNEPNTEFAEPEDEFEMISLE